MFRNTYYEVYCLRYTYYAAYYCRNKYYAAYCFKEYILRGVRYFNDNKINKLIFRVNKNLNYYYFCGIAASIGAVLIHVRCNAVLLCTAAVCLVLLWCYVVCAVVLHSVCSIIVQSVQCCFAVCAVLRCSVCSGGEQWCYAVSGLLLYRVFRGGEEWYCEVYVCSVALQSVQCFAVCTVLCSVALECVHCCLAVCAVLSSVCSAVQCVQCCAVLLCSVCSDALQCVQC